MAGRNQFLDQILDRIILPVAAVFLVFYVMKEHERQQVNKPAAAKKK